MYLWTARSRNGLQPSVCKYGIMKDPLSSSPPNSSTTISSPCRPQTPASLPQYSLDRSTMAAQCPSVRLAIVTLKTPAHCHFPDSLSIHSDGNKPTLKFIGFPSNAGYGNQPISSVVRQKRSFLVKLTPLTKHLLDKVSTHFFRCKLTGPVFILQNGGGNYASSF